MKINEIITSETMRGSNVDKIATKFANEQYDYLKSGNHIGDIEEYKVIRKSNFYSIWKESTLVGFASLTDESVVDDVWINPEYRGKKLFSKLLWFFKTRLNHPMLLIGKMHSPMMQEVIHGLSRFKKYWYNIETGQTTEFDPSTTDQYYDHMSPTQWRLILENTGDFSDWPRYTEGKSYIYENYSEFVK
jgi:hypothetical protein